MGGIPKDATIEAIKKAYRKLALRHHPDKATSEKDRAAAAARFAEIGEAYETLKDAAARAEYDQSIQPTLNSPPRGHGAGGFFQRGPDSAAGGFQFRGAAPSMFDFAEP